MERYKKIRKDIYNYHIDYEDFINYKSPYTFIKAIYYMETASLFLFVTQKIIKSPNLITFLYALTGVIGAFLLHSTQELLFYSGVFMVFTKGTFDWADGYLARRLNKTSFFGHALDIYGASVCDAAFRVVFIYYTLGYFPELMSLFPILTFIILITNFRIFCDYHYLKTVISGDKKQIKNIEFELDVFTRDIQQNKLKKWYFRFTELLGDRARAIDSLLLILLIDFKYTYDLSMLLLTLSVLMILRAIVIYIAGVYLAYKLY
jgi:phosphatidylglycerophosphate synthase